MARSVPQQQQQQQDKRWTPILSSLNPSSSARNNITSKKGSPGGLGSGFMPGGVMIPGGGSLLGG